jgi:hypothetical protein
VVPFAFFDYFACELRQDKSAHTCEESNLRALILTNLGVFGASDALIGELFEAQML